MNYYFFLKTTPLWYCTDDYRWEGLCAATGYHGYIFGQNRLQATGVMMGLSPNHARSPKDTQIAALFRCGEKRKVGWLGCLCLYHVSVTLISQ